MSRGLEHCRGVYVHYCWRAVDGTGCLVPLLLVGIVAIIAAVVVALVEHDRKGALYIVGLLASTRHEPTGIVSYRYRHRSVRTDCAKADTATSSSIPMAISCCNAAASAVNESSPPSSGIEIRYSMAPSSVRRLRMARCESVRANLPSTNNTHIHDQPSALSPIARDKELTP